METQLPKELLLNKILLLGWSLTLGGHFFLNKIYYENNLIVGWGFIIS